MYVSLLSAAAKLSLIFSLPLSVWTNKACYRNWCWFVAEFTLAPASALANLTYLCNSDFILHLSVGREDGRRVSSCSAWIHDAFYFDEMAVQTLATEAR